MRMNDLHEFKAHFPLCELSAWPEPADGGGQEQLGGGRKKGATAILPSAERLPFYICVFVILMASVECYVVGYQILAAAIRFFATS